MNKKIIEKSIKMTSEDVSVILHQMLGYLELCVIETDSYKNHFDEEDEDGFLFEYDLTEYFKQYIQFHKAGLIQNYDDFSPFYLLELIAKKCTPEQFDIICDRYNQLVEEIPSYRQHFIEVKRK